MKILIGFIIGIFLTNLIIIIHKKYFKKIDIYPLTPIKYQKTINNNHKKQYQDQKPSDSLDF